MKRSGLLASIAGAGVWLGCAGISVHPVSDDSAARGIRYYEPAPFLLVHSDGKGGLTSSVVILPDLSRKMSARPYAVLARNDATLQFQNGMLSSSKSVADETVIPKAVVSALEKVAIAAAKAAFKTEGEEDEGVKVPPPQLFKIVIEKDRVKLLGGPGNGELFVTRQVTKP